MRNPHEDLQELAPVEQVVRVLFKLIVNPLYVGVCVYFSEVGFREWMIAAVGNDLVVKAEDEHVLLADVRVCVGLGGKQEENVFECLEVLDEEGHALVDLCLVGHELVWSE